MHNKITIDNKGRRIIAGSSSKTLFDYLIQNNLNLSDFLCDNPTISIPNSVASGLSNQTKYNYNDFLDLSGALFSPSSQITICDDSKNQVYWSVLVVDKNILPDPSMEIELNHSSFLQNPIEIKDFNSDYVIFGEEYTEGVQYEYPFEQTGFDTKTKLKIYHTVIDNSIDLVTKVEYDQDTLINNLQNQPTVTKVKWFIQNNKTLERTRTQ